MKKFFSFLSFKKHRRTLYRHAFHVYRDWIVILGVTALLILVSMLLHLYFFYVAFYGDTSQKPVLNTKNALTVDRKALEDTVSSYQKSQADLQAKETETISVIDPSL